MSGRVVAALVIAAAVSAIGGFTLGEYEFSGLMPVIAGVLFGFVIAEIVLELGRQRSPIIAVVSAACVVGGLGWAAWIDSGEGLRPFPTGGWIAMALGAATVALRTSGISVRGRNEPAGRSQSRESE